MDSVNKMGETPGLRRARFHIPGQGSSWKLSVRLAGAALVVTAFAAAMFASAPVVRAQESQADAAVTACVSPIAACGCTITKSGFYLLANSLLSSQGLTANNGCIDISASKVVLNTGQPVTSGKRHGAFDITGPGGATPTGIGIHILKGSNMDFIEVAGGDVDGWDVGILVEGSNNIVEDFFANNNGTAGIEINGGKSNNINDFDGGTNKNYGVWVRGASGNQVNCSNTDDNGNIGVYVGCSIDGPINGKCSPKVPPSNNNLIYDHSADDNGKYGVVVDLGNSGNILTDLFTLGNSTMDLFDENPNCDKNRWFFDSFVKASPSCIE